MKFLHIVIVLSFLLTNSILAPSYAAPTYALVPKVDAVDKEKPKAQKKNQHHMSLRPYLYKVVLGWKAAPDTQQSAQSTSDWETVFFYSVIVIFILLSVPFIPIAFLIGILTGMVGWWVAGAMVTLCWFGMAAFHILKELHQFGLLVFGCGLLLFVGLFIWANISLMPILLILSLILGGMALLGTISALIGSISFK